MSNAPNPSSEIVDEQRLDAALSARAVRRDQWNTLCRSLYPGANPWSVLLLWDYCTARKLDPLKKPAHIVPMKVRNAKSGQHEWRDVIMPGVYELRTTAQRTGVYLGHSEPEYGPMIDYAGVSAPEWCAMTMYRWHEKSGQKVQYPVRVYFKEVVVLKEGKANERWTRSPIQMLTKCAEAAGLREAFPDEIGGMQTEEELAGRTIDAPDASLPIARMKPQTTAPQAKLAAPEPATLSAVLALADRKGIPELELLRRFDVGDPAHLTDKQLIDASDWLAGFES